MNLVERLREYNGVDEYRVQHPETGTYCISFDWHNTFNPKRAAQEWHADHKKRFPDSEYSTTYVVSEVRSMSQQDEVCNQAADRIESLEQLAKEMADSIHDAAKAIETIRLRYRKDPNFIDETYAESHAKALWQALSRYREVCGGEK